MVALRPLVSLAFGVAAVAWSAERAGASCAITLEGDPTTVARIQIELGGYPDEDSSCVALWVQCQTTGDQVEIDLHDELGRASLHLFASAEGAAAFIVSWSRRPLPPGAASTELPARPGAAASSASAVPAPRAPVSAASHDELLHPELAMAYIAASGALHSWGVVTASLVQRTGIFSYGVGLRAIIGGVHNSESAEGAAMFGIDEVLSERFGLLTGLMISGTMVGPTPTYPDVVYGSHGIRGSLYGTVRWHLLASLDVEARLAYDVLRFDGNALSEFAVAFGATGYVTFTHVDIGMRWVP